DDLNDKNSSDVTVNDESDERNSKRKREDKGKSVETEPDPSSKGEGSNEKVTNSESRESSSDFTSEEPEWLKNTQSVTGPSVSIPIEPLNSEVTPQPESTQSQGTTERVFVAPFYVDLDAYREELQSISSSLKKRGVAVESPKQPRQTKKSRAEAAARATFDEAWRDLVGRGQEISMKKKQEAFEKIGISIADLEKLPEAPQPDALLTNLLPYQKQGLGWMLSHEHPEDPTEEKATQFWVMRKVSGSNLYYNVATSYSSQTRPEFSRGGILAAAESSLDLTPENAQLLAKYLKEAIEDNEDC
ncbi:15832_t:CDS:2, partial [Racocetra fulgida]